MTKQRAYMLRVRMSQLEKDMLEALAAEAGLTASDIVRQSIRQQFATQHGAVPKEQRTAKAKGG